MRTNKATQGNW